jgi:hypothetical protein
VTVFEIIENHAARIRELVGEVDHNPATENERTIVLVLAHLTSAVEALAAHVAAQQSDGK